MYGFLSHSPARCRILAAAVAASFSLSCSEDPVKPPRITGGEASAQLATGTGYRRVWPGTVATSAVAARAMDPNFVKGALDLLRKNAGAFQLAEQASVDSVRITTAEPAAILFVDHPNQDGIGALFFAPLDGTSPKPVPQASGVQAGGASFGAGARMLFVSGYSADTDRGMLSWSDGSTTRALGGDAPPVAVLFDAGRAHAVAAVSVDGDGNGTLLAIDMAAGTSVRLAEKARVLGPYQRPAFAVAGDGSVAAFADPTGALMKVPLGGENPTRIATDGSLPALSGDGAVAAFFTKSKAALWTGAQVREVADATGAVAPILSADGASVAFATGVAMRGRGLLAEVSVAQVAGTATPVAVGAAVAWDSVQFSPKSGKLAAIVDVRDLTATPDYNGLGRLVFGTPTAAPVQVATRVPAGNAARFDVADRMVCVGSVAPGSGAGKVYVSVEGGAAGLLREGAVKGSLRAAVGVDWALFRADPRPDPIDDVFRAATLLGTTPAGPPVELLKNVIDAQLALDGSRALAVVADGDQAGVWSLPKP